jgi:DNA polymerase-3 subunit alpha
MSFTHLHTHTSFSLLDGSGKIPEMIARVKELGMDSLAITDHGVMYGVIDFYKEARKQGIRPILGCEIYLTPGSRFDRENSKGEDRYYHLVLLAENNTGYQNLMKIVSKGFVDGFYYKPRVDFDLLRQYHEGIIALSACLAGEVSKNLTRGLYDEAKKAALRYQEIFGPEHFYLELQDHGYPEQKKVNAGMLRLHEETGIPFVATNDIHYTYKEDAEAHDILLCLQTGKKVADEDRMRYPGGQFYIKSEEEMRALFPYAEEALDNTHKIAERCNVEIEFGHYHLPKYEVPEGYTSLSYLEELCNQGLKERYGSEGEKYRERLEYEIHTISSMGFVDYFLIVWDYIHYAKTHDIAVGPGRGSAAGSIVAYCIGITDIDPMRYQLIFERFLNPERVTMPDIDVDFEYERRQEVIDYVTRKYGKDCVSQIVTFGTLAAKGVIRDVGRVLDVPYAKCDTLAKLVPNELNMTLDRALETSPELKKMYDNDEDAHRIITMSKRLEGLPRHASMHAAGVVISSKPVEEFVPLSRSSDGSITTQFTMTTIEELGLLKMDFLGLRTLTVIKDACCSAMKNYGVSLDPATLDYDDKNIYDMISQGDTAGIFQLESGGMTSFMKSLKPTCLEDIIAGVALYRPGPMDFIPKYIDGKRHPERVSYDCPEMEPILKPTYGCIVYQEQVMQIVRDLAGYSMGRSDLVRRAMSKKKTAVMEKERQNFVYGNPEEQIPGCIARGISEATANHIYDEMIDFAKYAFNKSHAACYAVVSYQTAYLKYYYPAEFFAALMTSFMDNISKTAEYIEDVREMGIPILAPDVNEAEVGFSVSNGAIRYGLSAVKGVGRTAAEQIIRERELHGRYRDLEDFVVRVSERNINRRAIEYFILSGALDAFSGNRREKFAILPTILENKVKEKKDSMAGQMTLADLLGEDNAEAQEFKIRMPKLKEYPKEELLQFERDALGVYLSGHPLDQYRELMNRNCTASTADFRLDPDTAQVKLPDGQRVTVGGLITDVRTKTTKKNEQMAFLMLEDLVGTIEVLVFPRIYQDARAALVTDGKILIRGRVSQGDDADAKLIAESITAFEDVPRNLWLQFDTMETYKAKWQQAENVLFEHPGSNRVMVYLRQEKAVKHVRQDEAVRISDELMEALKAQLGEENVKVTWEVLKKVQR